MATHRTRGVQRVEARSGEKLRKLEHRLLEGPGTTEPEMRRAVANGDPVNDPLVDAYLEKIRRHAYTITQADIDGLRASGWDEDQIFELSILAAFGAARLRLLAGLGAVEAARGHEAPAPSPSVERGE